MVLYGIGSEEWKMKYTWAIIIQSLNLQINHIC